MFQRKMQDILSPHKFLVPVPFNPYSYAKFSMLIRGHGHSANDWMQIACACAG